MDGYAGSTKGLTPVCRIRLLENTTFLRRNLRSRWKYAASCGVKIFGGCCGTTPEYISALKKALDGTEVRRRKALPRSAVCTPSRTVVIDRPRIIGERINPTGKKAV